MSYSEVSEDYLFASRLPFRGFPGRGDLFNRAKDILRLIFPEVGPGLENQGAVIVSVVRRGEWDAIQDFTSPSSLFRCQVYSACSGRSMWPGIHIKVSFVLIEVRVWSVRWMC